jgi:hypothetical protein
MIDHNFEKRLTSTKVFYGYLSDVIANFSAIRSAKSKLAEQFQNKILLAVTQVKSLVPLLVFYFLYPIL